jgi:hypothetical protein
MDLKIDNESSSIKITENMMHKFGKNHKWDDVTIGNTITDYDFWMNRYKYTSNWSLLISINSLTTTFSVKEGILKHFEVLNN